MAGTQSQIPSAQTVIDFDQVKWPGQEGYPLNIRSAGRTVESVVYGDISDSSAFLILTGFTSLSNLVDLFGSKDHPQLNGVRVLIGFEPNIKGRKVYLRFGLEKEIKEYWVKRGLSILQGGAVIYLIEKIRSGWIQFRFRDKLHAKIYVGDRFATLGSSNFSKNGLNIQDEANIRVENEGSTAGQYRDICLIAESFYDEASPYNDKLIALLENLIGDATWQEALARAIAEMLEGSWLNEYKEIISRMSGANLWPTQWKGLAQAVSILQRQSNVLIADPTGAGKTRLCTALVLCLQHLLYETGKHHRTESLIICPPLVLKKWAGEFQRFGKINHNQVSMGMLSNGSPENKERIATQLKLANLLIIDEAHSYLADSGRTFQIKTNRADHKILITATPISRRVEDILSLVKLLDVDNLTDEAFKDYLELLKKPYYGNQIANVAMLREFISQFTVRRTKKRLNEDVEKDEEAFKNSLEKGCRFPKQVEKIYQTKETAADKQIVREIGELAKQLKGVTYLTGFRLQDFGEEDSQNLNHYVERRIFSARSLSIYMIRYALRSSHVALVEHIEGSEKAMVHFGFRGKSKVTGNKLKKIDDLIGRRELPYRQGKFKIVPFPEWLVNEQLYFEVCEKELMLYQEIAQKAKSLSGTRELGKVQELIDAAKTHRNLLAFDSTVISLYYLRKLFAEHYPGQKLLVASGSEEDKDSLKVLDVFKLESKDQERYIALCSDKMSESVDLQKASCVFLLDTPSVLRIVEQRIGRADRMDSMHKAIDIYWAYDSDEYSLKGDERLIETNHVVELIYGSNFQVPEILKGRRFTKTDSVEALIEEYKDFVDKDESWTGVEDRFQCIRNLKEGRDPLISEAIYQQFANVASEVKAKVSFISGSGKWCFIALRGDHRKSPHWYFIDENDLIESDMIRVTGLLRSQISKDAVRLKWDAPSLNHYVKLFKKKERELLPAKKRRALEVADHILRQHKQQKGIDRELDRAMNIMQELLLGRSEEIVDYDRLADEWIIVLQPYLEAKRESKKNKKLEYNLNSLKREHAKIELSADQLYQMAEQSIIAEAIDKRIASCIIAIGG
jgi:superfamily II DNA or RNA helicase